MLLDFLGDENGQLYQFRLHLQFATEPLYKQEWCCRAQVHFLRRFCISFDILYDIDGNGTPVRRTRLVQFENLRYFVGCSWATIETARNINRRGLDAVAIHPAKHFLFREVLVNTHCVVDEYLGNSGVLRHYCDKLEFVIQGLFFMRHTLPVRPFADFLHFVRGFLVTQDFAAIRRFG